jgi:hypothetical protein
MYHAVYSITIPIVLVELAYPKRRNERWMTNKKLAAVFAILLSDVVFGFFLFASFLGYWPPLAQYLPAIFVMILFGYSAYRLPADWGKGGKKRLPRLPITWAIAAFATFVFFFVSYSLHALVPVWQIGILFGPMPVIFYVKLLTRYNWHVPSEKYRFALASGALAFFIVFAPLQELDKNRTDNTVGMSLVGLAFLIGLVLLGRSIWKHEKKILE